MRRRPTALCLAMMLIPLAACTDSSGSGYLTVNGAVGEPVSWGETASWPLSSRTLLFEDSDGLCVELGDRALVTGVTAADSPEVEVMQAALQVAHWGKDGAFYWGAEDESPTLDRPYHRILPAAVDVRCDRREGTMDPANWVGISMVLRRTSATANGEAHLHGIDIAYDADGSHKVLHVPLDVRWCPSTKGCDR